MSRTRSTSERRYTAEYREECTLRDGTPIVFRLLRAEDKPLLSDGLARMSAESRFRRFFAHRDHLSPSELAYLTEIDHEKHFALGAARIEEGREVGLGVARFVVLDDASSPLCAAEAAIAVVDEVQGKGLGRLLFERLVQAAAERGVHVFRFDVLAENDNMLALVQRIFPDASSHVDDGIMTIDCPIPDLSQHTSGERPEGALYHAFKLVAEGAIRIFRGARERDAASPVLKSSKPPADHDLAELIALTDEDGPAPP